VREQVSPGGLPLADFWLFHAEDQVVNVDAGEAIVGHAKLPSFIWFLLYLVYMILLALYSVKRTNFHVILPSDFM
jgi:uncharacterized membrane protein